MIIAYAYLHGFGSSPNSHKGTRLKEYFFSRGLQLHCPDLRKPSFSKQTISRSLDALDQLHRQHAKPSNKPECAIQWQIIGSSLGAYIAALWAALQPERVNRLILLSPGFHIAQHIPRIVGQKEYEQWQQQGSLSLPDGDGSLQPLHWEFVRDCSLHPPLPSVRCPTRIIHGRYDDLIDIALIRELVTQLASAKLIEVEDDHHLMNSIENIIQVVETFFEIDAEFNLNMESSLVAPGAQPSDENSSQQASTDPPPLCTFHWDFFGPTAMRTAEHFLHHLNDFLRHHQRASLRTGISSTQTAHAEAWCQVTTNHDLAVIKPLRPHRKTDPSR